jgi:hypothetical protein
MEATFGKESKRDSSAIVKEGVMLIVEAWARKNLRITGESRVELSVPAQDGPVFAYFDVTPSKPGPAEVTVVIRRGTLPLTQLDLNVTAVEQLPETVDTVVVEAAGLTTQRPPPPMNQLRI